jgi:hypothetical protein
MLVGCVYTFDTTPIALDEGDITGVLVGVRPGGTGEEAPLAGGRVKLIGSAIIRRSHEDGRVTLRNLPEGRHSLLVTYDEDGDDEPDLARQLLIPIEIPAGRSKRPHVDLGVVSLLPPAILCGTVEASVLDGLIAALQGSDARAAVDEAGGFCITGLGSGQWTLAAAGNGAVSDVVVVDLEPGEREESVHLRVPDETGLAGTLRVRLLGAPTTQTSTSNPLTRALSASRIDAIPLSGQAAATLAPDGDSFSGVAPAGLYALRVIPDDESFLDVTLPSVLVLPGQTADLPVVLTPRPTAECVDLDDDGLCSALGPAPDPSAPHLCFQGCADNGACEEDGTSKDCDDDDDGQDDLSELRDCSCGFSTADGEPGCHNDPSRSDLDGDGICDAYDPFPRCDQRVVECASTQPDTCRLGIAPDAPDPPTLTRYDTAHTVSVADTFDGASIDDDRWDHSTYAASVEVSGGRLRLVDDDTSNQVSQLLLESPPEFAAVELQGAGQAELLFMLPVGSEAARVTVALQMTGGSVSLLAQVSGAGNPDNPAAFRFDVSGIGPGQPVDVNLPTGVVHKLGLSRDAAGKSRPMGDRPLRRSTPRSRMGPGHLLSALPATYRRKPGTSPLLSSRSWARASSSWSPSAGP